VVFHHFDFHSEPVGDRFYWQPQIDLSVSHIPSGAFSPISTINLALAFAGHISSL
jgi:hypothetical protein